MQSATVRPAGSNPVERKKLIPSNVLGVVVFVLTEMMFFGGLISAYMIVKAGNIMWPPPDQPRLPVTLTAFNTLFLVGSGVLVYLSNKSLARGDTAASKKQLGLAILLGLVFVGVQGFEWVRMLGHGLTMTSSTYGSFFYMIIGCHALHVFGALAVLINVFFKFSNSDFKHSSYWGVQVFWYFVVGVWPILYVLVYLS
ncbi:MAG: cytochrome c oxidase subunit 3 [Verrucomicrobia bacterium]|nr:cytochrome c oxidase subunit 3 [Verrucomicrobiota bacterium]MDA1066031.1 cytochrome c oxidase subunit 3 [Verrucomicrobiota bacterium]